MKNNPFLFQNTLINAIFLIAFFLSACSTVEKPQIKPWQKPEWTKEVSQQFEKRLKQTTQSSSFSKPKSKTFDPLWYQKISTHFEGIDIINILQGLSKTYKFSYSISEFNKKAIYLKSHQVELIDVINQIAQKVGFYTKIDGQTIHFIKDLPYWQDYQIPYPNLHRQIISKVKLSQSLSTGKSNANHSGLEINNQINNHYWKHLKEMLEEISKSEKNEVKLFPETGIITLKAKKSLHQKVEKMLHQIAEQSSRQALIEMSIIEVSLNNEYQAGIDWSLFDNNNPITQLSGQTLGSNISNAPRLVLQANGLFEGVGLNFGAKLVERFGSSKVISSPQLRLINNQTAVLKVIDNIVYFTIESDTIQTDFGTNVSFDTNINSLAVGLVISVTPFIAENGQLIINIKPTLSRISQYIKDPHPELAKNNIESNIPVIRERELETVLQIQSGDVAIIGGLIQNSSISSSQQIPGSKGLLGYDSDANSNTELVLFLRATIL